jgi:hypothetical protein
LQAIQEGDWATAAKKYVRLFSLALVVLLWLETNAALPNARSFSEGTSWPSQGAASPPALKQTYEIRFVPDNNRSVRYKSDTLISRHAGTAR